MNTFSQHSKHIRIMRVPHIASSGLQAAWLPDIPGAVTSAVHIKVGFLGRLVAAHLDVRMFGSGVVWYHC